MSESKPTGIPDAATALATLQRLEGKTEGTVSVADAAAGAPVRAPDGKFAPKEKEPSEPRVAEQAQEAKPSGEATAKAMTKALTALRRAQVPQSVLDATDEATRLEWGSKLAKAQADTDRLFREKRGETLQDPDADEASGTPESEADLDDVSVDEQVSDPASAMMRDFLASQARTQLTEDFPTLRDSKVWTEVRAKAIEMFETGDYDDHSEDWSETAATIIKDALYALGQRPSSKSPSPARSAGQPRVSKPEDRYTALKGMPRHLVTLKLMENDGMTPSQAREIADALGAR